jgi:hypothetical protein
VAGCVNIANQVPKGPALCDIPALPLHPSLDQIALKWGLRPGCNRGGKVSDHRLPQDGLSLHEVLGDRQKKIDDTQVKKRVANLDRSLCPFVLAKDLGVPGDVRQIL